MSGYVFLFLFSKFKDVTKPMVCVFYPSLSASLIPWNYVISVRAGQVLLNNLKQSHRGKRGIQIRVNHSYLLPSAHVCVYVTVFVCVHVWVWLSMWLVWLCIVSVCVFLHLQCIHVFMHIHICVWGVMWETEANLRKSSSITFCQFCWAKVS